MIIPLSINQEMQNLPLALTSDSTTNWSDSSCRWWFLREVSISSAVSPLLRSADALY